MPVNEKPLAERYPVEITQIGRTYSLSIINPNLSAEEEGSVHFVKSISRGELENPEELKKMLSRELAKMLVDEEMNQVIDYLVGVVLQALSELLKDK